MSKNPVIIFEGIEASGKSTNLDLAAKYLKNRGYSKFKFVNSAENPSHIIMTNRVTLNKGNDYTSKNLTNLML